ATWRTGLIAALSFQLVLDVGAVAQLAQPVLVVLLDATLAQRLARHLAQAVGRRLVGSPLEDLDQVHAERRTHRVADLARGERIHRALELGYGVAGIDPAEVTAAPRAAIDRVLARQVLEGAAAALHALPDFAQPAQPLVLADDLVGADQDVPCARLRDRRAADAGPAAGAAPVDQREHVEARRTAQQSAELPRTGVRQRVDEELRQALRRSPAERPAAHRLGRVRECGREPCKVVPALQLPDHLLAAQPLALDLLRRRAFGHRQQDLRDVKLGGRLRALRLRSQERVDVGIADLDAAVDLAFAQALAHDLFADVVAEARETRAVALDALAQLDDRQLALLGDRRQRTVHLRLVGTDAEFARRLRLRAIDDHPLEHLLLEHVGRRRLDVLRAKLPLGYPQAQRKLARRDRFAVHDRDDPIDRRRRLRRGRRRGDQPRDRREQRQRRRCGASQAEERGSMHYS